MNRKYYAPGEMDIKESTQNMFASQKKIAVVLFKLLVNEVADFNSTLFFNIHKYYNDIVPPRILYVYIKEFKDPKFYLAFMFFMC